MDSPEIVEHPRAKERKEQGPPTVKQARRDVHGSGLIARFNEKFGLAITVAVGSMWCAYLFALLALYGLPDAVKAGTYATVVWTSSSFLQLVLLPIIIVGQRIQAKASDNRAEATFKDADLILHDAERILLKATDIQNQLQIQDDKAIEIQKHLQVQDEKILAILTKLEAIAT